VTLYYDPILDVHLRLPTFTAVMNTLYLAPQVGDDSRRLFDAATEQFGMRTGDEPTLAMNERSSGIAWLVARDWGLDDLAARLHAGCEARYEPGWHGDEFWWGLGLDEPYPRGQLNAILAAAEATTPGAWTAFANQYTPYDGPEVCGVDLDTIAITQASWTGDRLLIGVAAASRDAEGRPTSFRVHGLDDAASWTVDGDATLRSDGDQLVIELRAQPAALSLHRP
jgi:hypothetical protein